MRHLAMLVVVVGLLLAPPLIAAERVVVCEMFTSTTCPPCAPANTYFDYWLQNFGDAHRVAVVKYHVWWPSPGNDPFYWANPTEVQVRNSYYQGSSSYAPRMFIDGLDAGSSYGSWPGIIQNRLSVASPFEISIDGSLTSSGGTLNITVQSDGSAIPSGTLVLHVVIVESDLYYTGTNQQPVHHHVMRKMLPNASGETFTITPGGQVNFQRTVTWNPAWELMNSEIVAFVQVQGTKAMTQGAKKEVRDLLVGVAQQDELPSKFRLFQNHPNPFNPSTNISFHIPHKSDVSLKVFDLLGREVTTLVSGEKEPGRHNVIFEANDLPSGVYYYRLMSGEFVETKRFVLLK